MVKRTVLGTTVGAVAGGVLLVTAGPALAKASVEVSADHTRLRVGQVLHLKGYADDDSSPGFSGTHFCFQVQNGPHHWTQVGTCAKAVPDGADQANYRLQLPMYAKGRYVFRGYVTNHKNHRKYYISDPLTITVY